MAVVKEIPIEPAATSADDTDDGPVHWNPVKTSLLLIALCSHYFSEMLFIVGSGVYARDIASVVGGASLSSWPASAIVILTAAGSTPIAQAADYFGRKWLLVIPTSLGFVGSIVVAKASTMQMAIAGFTLGGASFGAQSLVHAVASEVIPRKYRSYAQSSINSSIALGSIFSLAVGGALVQNNPEGFRTYWYICAGVYALSTILLAVLYNPAPREMQLILTLKQKLRALDWTGYFLFDAGLVTFCLGLSYSQNPFEWTNAHVVAPFLIGCALVITLIIYEWKFKKDGLFHHGLFRHRNFPIALTGVFIEGFAFMAANIYFPYEMSVLLAGQISSYRVNLCYIIAFVALLIISASAGVYIHRTKTTRGPAVTSFVSFLVFFIVMSTISASVPESHFWGFIVFYGAGLGICLITLMTTAQLSTPPELISLVSGLMSSMRSVGGAVGVAIHTALFTHGLTTNLGSKVAAAVLPLGLAEDMIEPLVGALTSGNEKALADITGVTPEIIAAAGLAVKKSYVIGFRDVFICGAAFALLGIVLSVFIKDPKKEFNSKIDAPLEGTNYTHTLQNKGIESGRAETKHLETTQISG